MAEVAAQSAAAGAWQVDNGGRRSRGLHGARAMQSYAARRPTVPDCRAAGWQ